MVFPLLMSPFFKECFSHVKCSILFCAANFSSHVDFASMVYICVPSCISGSLFLVHDSTWFHGFFGLHACVLCALEHFLHGCLVLKLMKTFAYVAKHCDFGFVYAAIQCVQ